MDNKLLKMEMTGEIMLDNAFLTYSLLKEEVKRWQDERGSFWIERLSPDKIPLNDPINELPEKAVLELCQRLNEASNIVVSDFELLETWNKLKGFQQVMNIELFSRLQIALSGVAQVFRRAFMETEGLVNSQDHDFAEIGSSDRMGCPICGELAGVSVLYPHGKRYLHCSMCGHEWLTKRLGCVRCGSQEASKIDFLHSNEFPGVEVIVCQACGQYSKEFDFRLTNGADIDWDNIRTLPLDYAAEKWLADQAVITGKLQ